MSGLTLLGSIDNFIRRTENIPIWVSKTALLTLIQAIPYLPYAIRKHLLDCTRIQSSQMTNSTLHLSYSKLVTNFPSISLPRQIVIDLQIQGIIPKESLSGDPLVITCVFIEVVLQLFENFYDSPTACTILSYMVRAEHTIFPEQFIKIGTETMDKEIKAS